MEYKQLSDETYVFRLEIGEDIVEQIESFCQKQHIVAAEINGIGALKELEIKHYSVDKQEYAKKHYTDEFEICSLYGLVTTVGLHAHIVVSNAEMVTFGGHLSKGIVGATCEGTIRVFPQRLNRMHDEKTGLKILNLNE